MSKKTLTIFILLSLIFLTIGYFVSAKDLEVDYPDVGPKTPAPTSTEVKLTEYIRYVFALSIRIAGFIALGVMIYGGIKWLVSGGSPGKIVDARSQILGGFLGIIILLSSYLILKTINPTIISTTITITPTADCTQCNFDQDTGEIDNCNGHEEWQDYCKLELDHFKSPGVYLIGDSEETERVHLISSLQNLTSLTNEVTKTTIDLNNKVTEIRFGRKNTEFPESSDKEFEEYCAILHEYKNFEGPARVICRGENTSDILGPDPNDPRNLTGSLGWGDGVSSITIFRLDPEATGRVVIWDQQDFHGHSYKQVFTTFDTLENSFLPPQGVEDLFLLDFEDTIYSVQVEGNFLVLLCGEDIYSDPAATGCQPFTSSIFDIRETTMGLCDPEPIHEEEGMYWIYHSCVDAFAIYKIKPMGYVQ